MRAAKTDQTGRMPRLIWVFAGRTCHFAGFAMRRLKFKNGNSVHTSALYNQLVAWSVLKSLSCHKRIAYIFTSICQTSILWNSENAFWDIDEKSIKMMDVEWTVRLQWCKGFRCSQTFLCIFCMYHREIEILSEARFLLLFIYEQNSHHYNWRLIEMEFQSNCKIKSSAKLLNK